MASVVLRGCKYLEKRIENLTPKEKLVSIVLDEVYSAQPRTARVIRGLDSSDIFCNSD
jgi:hypothetical protein